MTNYERIKTMKLDELTDFLACMVGLLNPSTCEGCPAYEKCKEQDDAEYTSCIDSVRDWLTGGGLEDIRAMSIVKLADFLGGIGRHIFEEHNCCDCPAANECQEYDVNCGEAFRHWLEAEAEAEAEAEDCEGVEDDE